MKQLDKLRRFGVSLENNLLKNFDSFIKKKGYKTRSAAIRDLIRKELVEKEWEEGEDVIGIISFVYDHSRREILSKIVEIQHHHLKGITSSQHIHLDSKNCLEILVIRGRAKEIKELADRIESIRGVKLLKLIKGSSGREL